MRSDQNAGFATLSVGLAADGHFQGTPSFRQVPMLGALPGTSRIDGQYQLNIQRAQSPTVVTAQNGSEYALVADYFFDFLDPLYANDESGRGARQMGGKIGIIKDPFGARPEYLGATSPIIDGNFSRLLVSGDGKTCGPICATGRPSTTTPPPSGLLIWDLGKLIAAAERNSLSRQASPRPLPIDRELVTAPSGRWSHRPGTNSATASRSLPAGSSGWPQAGSAHPTQWNSPIPSMADDFLRTIEPDANQKVPEFNYGDIARVDLFKLIRSQYPATLSGLTDEDLQINWSNIEVSGAATLVKDARGFLLTAEREDGLPSVEAAVKSAYSGLQTVASDAGKKALNASGIIFLAPTLDMSAPAHRRPLTPRRSPCSYRRTCTRTNTRRSSGLEAPRRRLPARRRHGVLRRPTAQQPRVP